MNKSKRRVGHLFPIISIAILLFSLAVMSFVPVFRSAVPAALESGSAPDAEAMRVLGCCRAYCAANDFDTKLAGTVRARVFGIPYVQNVSGVRSVRADGYVETLESASALVKAAVKKQVSDGKYLVSTGEYKNKKFVFGKPKELTRADFTSAYGLPATGLVKFVLDGAVVSAEQTDKNEYRYVLDVARATEYSRNEYKTLLGGKSYPQYDSVEFTIVTDGERAAKITVREKFRINKCGGTSCTAVYSEVFDYGTQNAG